MLCACATPSPPRSPNESAPEAVADLTAQQVGTSVILHFTLPRLFSDGVAISGPRRVEIDRSFSSGPTGSSAAGQAQEQAAAAGARSPLVTLDEKALAALLTDDTVDFTDAFSGHEFQAHVGQEAIYRVRTAAGASAWSADSNAAAITLAVPPADVQGLTGVPAPPQGVTAIPAREPSGSLEVDLSWAISGASDLAGYNVYRGEPSDERGVRVNRRMLLAPAYRDTTVAPGAAYRYWVTAVNAEGKESAPSAPVTANVPAASRTSP